MGVATIFAWTLQFPSRRILDQNWSWLLRGEMLHVTVLVGVLYCFLFVGPPWTVPFVGALGAAYVLFRARERRRARVTASRWRN